MDKFKNMTTKMLSHPTAGSSPFLTQSEVACQQKKYKKPENTAISSNVIIACLFTHSPPNQGFIGKDKLGSKRKVWRATNKHQQTLEIFFEKVKVFKSRNDCYRRVVKLGQRQEIHPRLLSNQQNNNFNFCE